MKATKPVSQLSAGMLRSSGEAVPSEEEQFRLKPVLQLGKRYFGSQKWLILGYILLTLAYRPVLPVIISLKLADLTNYFQQNQSEQTKTVRPAANAASEPGLEQKPAQGISRENLLPSYVWWLLLSILFVPLSGALRYLMGLLDGRVANAMRMDVFNAILAQSPEFFFEYDADRLTVICNQFCIQAEMGLRQILIDPILQAGGIVIAGVTLYTQLLQLEHNGGSSAWLTFLAISLFALIAPFLVNLLGRFLQRDASAVQQHNLRLATLVGGAISSAEEIQAMRAEDHFGRKHLDALQGSLKARLHQALSLEKLNCLNAAPGTFVLAALLGAAVYLVLTGRGGVPGVVVSLLGIAPQFTTSIQLLSGIAVTARISWPGITLVHSILQRPVQSLLSPAGGDQTVPDGTLEARNVTFRYNLGTNSRNVLDGVSFSIPPGRSTGLVARPGQGKTTFFRLALRFYKPQSGDILLGGKPVSSLALGTVRREIVLMSQFPAFFHDSVRENFRVAAPDATDAEIMAMAANTGLLTMLQANFGEQWLEHPFDAGGRLSGGQKKLFALTRCLLRKPKVLLLDEPTTGMGPLEKYPLIAVMKKACEGTTTVLVDHDIVWQSRFCEYALVLHEGKIVQQGTPLQLRSEPGLFRDLYQEATAEA